MRRKRSEREQWEAADEGASGAASNTAITLEKGQLRMRGRQGDVFEKKMGV